MKKMLLTATGLIALSIPAMAQNTEVRVMPDTLGEKFEKKGDLLKPGSLWVYPAKHAHYAWTGSEEGILQVQFTAPGGIDYINPADDPRKQ